MIDLSIDKAPPTLDEICETKNKLEKPLEFLISLFSIFIFVSFFIWIQRNSILNPEHRLSFALCTIFGCISGGVFGLLTGGNIGRIFGRLMCLSIVSYAAYRMDLFKYLGTILIFYIAISILTGALLSKIETFRDQIIDTLPQLDFSSVRNVENMSELARKHPEIQNYLYTSYSKARVPLIGERDMLIKYALNKPRCQLKEDLKIS